MKNIGLWLVMILALAPGANVGCRSRSDAPGAQKSSVVLEPILGSLDAPTPGSTMRETGLVGGWALAGSGIRRIAIYIDRQFIRFVEVDGKRPDVGKIFSKDYPGAEKSGWTFILDVSKMADGNHELVAKAESNKGTFREFGPVPFQVVH